MYTPSPTLFLQDKDDEKYLFVGFLLTRQGSRIERLGLKIPGAFTYSAEQVNKNALLPDGYKLRYEVS